MIINKLLLLDSFKYHFIINPIMASPELISLLRTEGYRITPQRIAIIDYVLETKSHPTAEQIHKEILKNYPMTSLSTVYKTIELMKAKNLISETGSSDKTRFGIVDCNQINLICNNCGRIESYTEKTIKEIEIRIKRKSQFEIQNARMEFLGLCKHCKKKQ